jgi:alpha-tubulin suppressor-like RCC1 family protein
MRIGVACVLLASCTFRVELGGNAPIDASDAPVVDMAIDEIIPPDPCQPVQVAASSAHNCVRMANGDVWCWGMNTQGQVGRPAQRNDCQSIYACNPLPERIDVGGATGMGMGDQHACVIAGATTYCFGANDSGQFGDNSGDSAVPIVVAQRANASEIVAGDTHTCSRHGGEVRCSGQNGRSECGDGTITPRTMPVVTLASGSDAIGTGYRHMCSVDDGLVYCWGDNGLGQVSGAGTPVGIPRLVQNVSDVIAVTAGLAHTCALQMGGTVRCWGYNGNGQLGVGNATPIGPVTAQVAGIVQISAGVNHTCALASGGTVYCWGEGYTNTPAEVPLPSLATQIASGSYHDCFVLAPSSTHPSGSVYCRGWDGYGQLGRGGTPGQTLGTGPVTLCPGS